MASRETSKSTRRRHSSKIAVMEHYLQKKGLEQFPATIGRVLLLRLHGADTRSKRAEDGCPLQGIRGLLGFAVDDKKRKRASKPTCSRNPRQRARNSIGPTPLLGARVQMLPTCEGLAAQVGDICEKQPGRLRVVRDVTAAEHEAAGITSLDSYCGVRTDYRSTASILPDAAQRQIAIRRPAAVSSGRLLRSDRLHRLCDRTTAPRRLPAHVLEFLWSPTPSTFWSP